MSKQHELPWDKPVLMETGLLDAESGGLMVYRCPVCDYRDTLDGFDVMGADQDCVFCNACNTELAQ